MKSYEMSEELKNALIEFLSKRPYAEVYVLIHHLSQIPEIMPIKQKKIVNKMSNKDGKKDK